MKCITSILCFIALGLPEAAVGRQVPSTKTPPPVSTAQMGVQNRATFSPRRVKLRYVYSPYADYLFYLLYRNTNEFASLSSAVPIESVPKAGKLVSLSELSASRQIRSYKSIYRLLDDYKNPGGRVILRPKPKILGYSEPLPSFDVLRTIIKQGETSYPAFFEYWQREIAPRERETIAAWQKQASQCAPIARLQTIERLRFPFASLDIGAIALHLAGSGNYNPHGVYTRLFEKPNLPWVLGHEATHLLVNKYAGHNWTRHTLAAEAIAAVTKHGGKEEDIEEALCLFMQVILSQDCGYTTKTTRISQRLGEDAGVKKQICEELENHWNEYLNKPDKYLTIIDYLMHCTLEAMSHDSMINNHLLRNS